MAWEGAHGPLITPESAREDPESSKTKTCNPLGLSSFCPLSAVRTRRARKEEVDARARESKKRGRGRREAEEEEEEVVEAVAARSLSLSLSLSLCFFYCNLWIYSIIPFPITSHTSKSNLHASPISNGNP